MPFIINISDRRQGYMQNSKCLLTLQLSETGRKLSKAEWCEPVPPKEFLHRNPVVLWILHLWAWSPVSPRGTWLSWWRWERSEGFCLVVRLGLSRYWSTFSGRRLSSRFAGQLEPTADSECFKVLRNMPFTYYCTSSSQLPSRCYGPSLLLHRGHERWTLAKVTGGSIEKCMGDR